MNLTATPEAMEQRRPQYQQLTRWCAKFKISPNGEGFVTESGCPVYPAHAVTETDGTIWFSAPPQFDRSGIQGHVETSPAFRNMLSSLASDTNGQPDGISMTINGRRFQIISQNLKETGGNHIINVAFIDRSGPLAGRGPATSSSRPPWNS